MYWINLLFRNFELFISHVVAVTCIMNFNLYDLVFFEFFKINIEMLLLKLGWLTILG